MDTAMVNKADLLTIIRENRANHELMFAEAVEGFQTATLKLLQDELQKFVDHPDNVRVNANKPSHHLKEYDRIIRMLEMHNAEEIEISQSDFAKYVEDDWEWKRQWALQNVAYSAGAANYLENS